MATLATQRTHINMVCRRRNNLRLHAGELVVDGRIGRAVAAGTPTIDRRCIGMDRIQRRHHRVIAAGVAGSASGGTRYGNVIGRLAWSREIQDAAMAVGAVTAAGVAGVHYGEGTKLGRSRTGLETGKRCGARNGVRRRHANPQITAFVATGTTARHARMNLLCSWRHIGKTIAAGCAKSRHQAARRNVAILTGGTRWNVRCTGGRIATGRHHDHSGKTVKRAGGGTRTVATRARTADTGMYEAPTRKRGHPRSGTGIRNRCARHIIGMARHTVDCRGKCDVAGRQAVDILWHNAIKRACRSAMTGAAATADTGMTEGRITEAGAVDHTAWDARIGTNVTSLATQTAHRNMGAGWRHDFRTHGRHCVQSRILRTVALHAIGPTRRRVLVNLRNARHYRVIADVAIAADRIACHRNMVRGFLYRIRIERDTHVAL